MKEKKTLDNSVFRGEDIVSVIVNCPLFIVNCSLAIALAIFTSCGNKATYLKVEPDTIVMGKQGGTMKIAVKTDASRWSIKWCPEWADASKDGDTLIFNCSYLQTKTNNIDTLYIEAGDITTAISVKQFGRASFVKFTPDLLHFPQAGGTAKATLETNAEKIKITSDSNVDASIAPSECSPSTSSGTGTVKTITLTLTPNKHSDEISSYVIVKCDQIEGRLHYIQEGTGKSMAKKKQTEPCSECGGLGKLLTSYNLYTKEKTYEECPLCQGTGKK